MATAKQKLALNEYEFDSSKYKNTTDYKSVSEARSFIYAFNRNLHDDIQELENYIYSLSSKNSAFTELEAKGEIIIKLLESDDIYIKNTVLIPDNIKLFTDVIKGDFTYEIKLSDLTAEFEKVNVFYTEASNNLRLITLKDFTEKDELERIEDIENILRSVIASMNRNIKTAVENVDTVIECLGNFDFEAYQNKYPKFWKENK